MNSKRSISSQITFLYFDDLISVIPFFEKTLNLELVTKQDAARIYRMAGSAFIGIVDGNVGHWRPKNENARIDNPRCRRCSGVVRLFESKRYQAAYRDSETEDRTCGVFFLRGARWVPF